MPTITNRLVSALSVNPADLVTTIDIEAHFQPIVKTLRLCNIFGGTAPVATLPTELIDQIEEYLTADKVVAYAKRLDQVRALYDCITKNCSPWFDHLTDEQKLLEINERLEWQGERPTNSLHSSEAEVVQEDILVAGDDRDGYRWQDDHLVKSREWYGLVGQPGQEGDGLFDMHKGFMLKEYGLEVFVTHKQTGYCEWKTLTYLTLPNMPASLRDKVCFDETCCAIPQCRLGSTFCQVVDDIAHEVTVPRAPSQEERARFARMVAFLGPLASRFDNRLRPKPSRLEVPTLKLLTRVELGERRRDPRVYRERGEWYDPAEEDGEGAAWEDGSSDKDQEEA
ncbi:hypothetical protein LTR15_005304 [Elasticomyces elasticus]|nr:hypothetical protein LTR15_005304 [Elasticomyces elasticus]